jgi:hypothetical protein
MQRRLNVLFIFLASLCCQLHASSGCLFIDNSFGSAMVSSDKQHPLEVYLESYDGDFVGGSNISHCKGQASPFILGTEYGRKFPSCYENLLTFSIDGWNFEFIGPHGEAIQQGTFNAERHPYNNPVKAGMNVNAHGNRCGKIVGEFTVIDIVYDETNRIISLALDFVQICNRHGYLKGFIRYNSQVPMPESKKSLLVTTYTPWDVWSNYSHSENYKEKLDYLYPICREGKMHVISFSAGVSNFEFSAPSGKLTVGEYYNAEVFEEAEDNKPGMDIWEFCEDSDQLKGHFRVIAIEYEEDGAIGTLALDFLQYREDQRYFAGSIRYNSDIPLTEETEILEGFSYSDMNWDNWDKPYGWDKILEELRELKEWKSKWEKEQIK